MRDPHLRSASSSVVHIFGKTRIFEDVVQSSEDAVQPFEDVVQVSPKMWFSKPLIFLKMWFLLRRCGSSFFACARTA